MKPACQLVFFPVCPDAWKGHLPVEEVFLCDQHACLAKYLGKALPFFALGFRLLLAHGNVERIAKLTIEEDFQRGLARLTLDVEPVDRVDQLKQRIKRRGHFLDLGKHVCRSVRLGNLRVGQPLNDLHLGCRS